MKTEAENRNNDVLMYCKGSFCVALTGTILSVQQVVEVKTSSIIASIFAGLIYWSSIIQHWMLTLYKAAALIPLFTVCSRPWHTFLLIMLCHLFHHQRHQRTKKVSKKYHKNQETHTRKAPPSSLHNYIILSGQLINRYHLIKFNGERKKLHL